MLNEASLEQLLAWNAEPGLLPRVPAGPDRGRAWSELDNDSLRRFAGDRDEDVRFSADAELQRRQGSSKPTFTPPGAQGRLL